MSSIFPMTFDSQNITLSITTYPDRTIIVLKIIEILLLSLFTIMIMSLHVHLLVIRTIPFQKKHPLHSSYSSQLSLHPLLFSGTLVYIYPCFSPHSSIVCNQSAQFHGACLDTEVQRSFCIIQQTRAYSHTFHQDLILTPTPSRLKLCDQIYPSIGTFPSRVPAGTNLSLSFTTAVVDADRPLIIGLDVLKCEGMLINYITNVLTFEKHTFSLLILDKHGHRFVQWPVHAIY